MHYHLEIVMPPTEDVEQAIANILEPFDENGVDEDGNLNRYSFWDWYVIGGRWSGHKLTSGLDPKKIEAFYSWLEVEKVTVSSVIAGKQDISPKTQIPKIDAKWREMFPNTVNQCPLFNHYKGNTMDVCRLDEVAEGLTCEQVIFAIPSYSLETNARTGPCAAVEMYSQSVYNGVSFQGTSWDGKLDSAVNKYRDSLKNAAPQYREIACPQASWLVVTVDYHT